MLMFTLATGTEITVTVVAPLLPSALAVTVTDPTEIAVTRPVADTVATALFPEVQLKARPVSTLFDASCAVAVNCCVALTVRVALVGEMLTLVIGTAATVTGTMAFRPAISAVIEVLPMETPVTIPLLETAATAGD
jgi:hypothetical protein